MLRGFSAANWAARGPSATVRVTTMVLVARLFQTSMASISTSLEPTAANAETRKRPLLDTGTAVPSRRTSAISLSSMTRPAISYSPVAMVRVEGTWITGFVVSRLAWSVDRRGCSGWAEVVAEASVVGTGLPPISGPALKLEFGAG